MAEFEVVFNLSSRVKNEINKSEKKGEKRLNVIGKDDRATTEQVLDPRTRLILFKLLNSGFLIEIDGCLSTGKEANVYYARGQEGREYAIKIFKTSILVFKDRDKYVSGEYRFANGYCKSNPRKMVRVWAEKEMRNLRRMHASKLPCPEPLLLKSHILIMEFLGNDGWCSPRLKDAELTTDELISCYYTIAIDMRKMYQECKLVHGDLSEYNILWHNQRPVIIDVSQSVEQYHPLASEFLRKDCSNITEFFNKKGFNVLSTYRLYQFVTVPSNKFLTKQECTLNTDADVNILPNIECEPCELLKDELLLMLETYSAIVDDEAVEYEMEIQSSANTEDKIRQKATGELEESMFFQTFIPTSLNELVNMPFVEKDKLERGERDQLYTDAVNNMLVDKLSDDEDSNSDNDSDVSSDDSAEYEERDGMLIMRYRRTLPTHDKPEERQKEKDERKAAKKLAKLQAAEKRKIKIPKHIKKRAMKVGNTK